VETGDLVFVEGQNMGLAYSFPGLTLVPVHRRMGCRLETRFLKLATPILKASATMKQFR